MCSKKTMTLRMFLRIRSKVLTWQNQGLVFFLLPTPIQTSRLGSLVIRRTLIRSPNLRKPNHKSLTLTLLPLNNIHSKNSPLRFPMSIKSDSMRKFKSMRFPTGRSAKWAGNHFQINSRTMIKSQPKAKFQWLIGSKRPNVRIASSSNWSKSWNNLLLISRMKMNPNNFHW